MTHQLVLTFPFESHYRLENFFVSEANMLAFDWLKRWPFWRDPHKKGGEMIAYGPEGCGKTHLIHAFCSVTKTFVIPRHFWQAHDMGSLRQQGEAYDSWALDDAQRHMCDERCEKTLLAILHHCHQYEKTLLMTARHAATMWRIKLADLSSRIHAMPCVPIRQPDDALLHAVIKKLCLDRQCAMDAHVIDFVLSHMERRFDAALRLVSVLDEESTRAKQKITIPMVKKIFDKNTPNSTPRHDLFFGTP